MAGELKVVIDDDAETVFVDPDTGTIEEYQDDGGVVVRLDAHRPAAEDGGDDWFANLVDDIDSSELGIIAEDLMDAIKADDQSRQEWQQTYARGLTMLGTKLEEPSSGVGDGDVEGMSKVTNPLLLEACLKGWANAQAELLPASGPAKIQVTGDETSASDDSAEQLERGMNHYLTKTAKEYYPDTSHMLLWGVYFGGSGFKKVYRCPMRRRPVSESVAAKDLILAFDGKDLSSMSRITHQIMMRPGVMKRMQLIGAYRDVALTQPNPTPGTVDGAINTIQGTQAPTRPEDQPYTIWETQCELDIPKYAPGKFKDEGIPLPYIVTLDKDSREILAIRRDWEEDDEDCERQQMYVKYPYIPGPGIYGTGMLNILGNSSAALTAAWREALDAGMFSSFPGGFIAKMGTRQETSNFRLAPGEFQAIDTGSLPISQVVTGLPYRDASPGLMTLIDKITAQAQALGGSAEIPAAEGLANVPVGTMLAQIEQATKVMAAAHKGMHQAQGEELSLLIELFRRNPEDFWRQNKDCPKDYWTEQKFLQALDDHNLVPVSDPNVPSHIHRVAKALGLVQLVAIPDFGARLNKDEVVRRVLVAMREDPIGLLIAAPPAPPPSPEDTAKLMTAQAKMKDADAKAGKLQSEANGENSQAQVKMAELDAQKEMKAADVTRELVIHAADQQKIEAADRRQDAALAAKTESDKRAAELAEQKHGLDLVKTGVEAEHRDREHDHKEGLAQHEAGLGLASHALEADKVAHDQTMDVFTALNPPPAAASPKKPRKK